MKKSLRRVEKITGQPITFYEANVRDEDALRNISEIHSFDTIIHLAGIKAVGESVQKPLLYYRNNLDSTLVLVDMASKFG